MRFTDFEALVRRLEAEVPPQFLDGVAGVEVSRKVLPHPTRAGTAHGAARTDGDGDAVADGDA